MPSPRGYEQHPGCQDFKKRGGGSTSARRHDLIFQTPGTEANPPRASLPIASRSGAAGIAASEPPPPRSGATGARRVAATLRAALSRPPAPASPPGRPRERPAGRSGGSRRGVTHGGASPSPPRPGRPGSAQRTRSAQSHGAEPRRCSPSPPLPRVRLRRGWVRGAGAGSGAARGASPPSRGLQEDSSERAPRPAAWMRAAVWANASLLLCLFADLRSWWRPPGTSDPERASPSGWPYCPAAPRRSPCGVRCSGTTRQCSAGSWFSREVGALRLPSPTAFCFSDVATAAEEY